MKLTATLHTLRRRIRTANYLRKWVVLGAMIGVAGGLGAIVFYTALELATRIFLGGITGYFPPSRAGEGGRRSPTRRSPPSITTHAVFGAGFRS